MKRNVFLAIILVAMMIGAVVVPVMAKDTLTGQLNKIRDVTATYHNIRNANVAGYMLVKGLDYCFEKPGAGGMGYHYINTALLDTTLDPLKPEAMVYQQDEDGTLHLGAVEYIVPAAAWDKSHSQPPVLFDQTFGLEKALGVYELHAWIWRHNPSGVFSEWNPAVSCK